MALFDRFPCDAVFGLHNDPSLAFGHIGVKEGPMMAAVDECHITVNGHGGHGAEPQAALDPIVCGASIIMALQTVASRNIHPLDPTVVIGRRLPCRHGQQRHSGAGGEMILTIRSFDPNVRDELERRIRMIAEGQAASYGMSVTLDYRRGYEATVNHKAENRLRPRSRRPDRRQGEGRRPAAPFDGRRGLRLYAGGTPRHIFPAWHQAHQTKIRRCITRASISTTTPCRSAQLLGGNRRSLSSDEMIPENKTPPEPAELGRRFSPWEDWIGLRKQAERDGANEDEGGRDERGIGSQLPLACSADTKQG